MLLVVAKAVVAKHVSFDKVYYTGSGTPDYRSRIMLQIQV